MKTLRVAIISDFVEEGWLSMDFVANMLFDGLGRYSRENVQAVLIRPSLRPILQKVPLARRSRLAKNADRVANRHWIYPRMLNRLHGRFDVFHIVDHSYAHLVHKLPARRVVV